MCRTLCVCVCVGGSTGETKINKKHSLLSCPQTFFAHSLDETGKKRGQRNCNMICTLTDLNKAERQCLFSLV